MIVISAATAAIVVLKIHIIINSHDLCMILYILSISSCNYSV